MAILLNKNGTQVEAKADTNGFLLVTEAYARAQENVNYKRMNASGSVFDSNNPNRKARLWGILVNSVSGSPTLTVKDGDSSGVDVFSISGSSITAGQQYNFYGCICNGVYISISGSITLTVFYEPLE